jgi:hypothetical protein
MRNKKGSVVLVFLIASILIVSSGLIVTYGVGKSNSENDVSGTGQVLLDREQDDYGSLSDLSFEDEIDNDFENFKSLSSSSSGGGGSSSGGGGSSSSSKNSNMDLLKKYETNYKQFKKIEIGDKTIFFQQRMIGDAIVEKDFKIYQIDKNSGKLLKKKINWRDDLLEYLPLERIMISKEQAESMVEGEVQFSKLYIISPESDVFPIKPTPKNPCWVVRSIVNSIVTVTIVDSMSGEILGYGIPPPYTAFSLTGPTYSSPCKGSWDAWANNARDWFNIMGYSTEMVTWPTENQIKRHIQNSETLMFYEIAHGGSTRFTSGCIGETSFESTSSTEIETWIANYRKMPFTFLGSCNSMCSIEKGTFSYEFRKGSNENTATIGFCGMGQEHCSNCWSNEFGWESLLFYYMSQGYTVKDAFDEANADIPICLNSNCVRFAGDENFKVVSCEPLQDNYCKYGDIYHNTICSNLVGVLSEREEKLEDCEFGCINGKCLLESEDITVCKNGSCDYTKIQDALDDNFKGIRIIDKEVYNEQLIWRTNGESLDCQGAVLDGGGLEDKSYECLTDSFTANLGIFTCKKNNVIIKNCEIRNFRIGTLIYFGGEVSINNNIISSNIYGVGSVGSNNLQITSNTFCPSNDYDIRVDGFSPSIGLNNICDNPNGWNDEGESGCTYSCSEVFCFSDLDCGTNGFIENPFCLNDDIFQNYRSYTCNNPGEINSFCSYTDTPQLKEECGEDYFEDWQDDYCNDGDVYHKRICYDKGCSTGSCDDTSTIEEQKVQVCNYGCTNGECKKPDLVVENFYYNDGAFKFRIKNIGNAMADPVYWMIDTDFSNEFLERTKSVSLAPGKSTLGGFLWTYFQSGSYNPKVIVDFDNLVDESDETNNEESISVTV